MEIELVLSQNGQPLMMLTDNLIQSMDFVTAKKSTYLRQSQTRDIAMRIHFENSTVRFRSPLLEPDDENMGVRLDEIDSVRDLFAFAISSYKKQFAFFDGNVKIVNEFGQVANFSYKNLFVLKYSEEYMKNERITFINILMREKVR